MTNCCCRPSLPLRSQAGGQALSPDRARALQRAVADDIQNSMGGDAPEDTAQSYLIGQPVGWRAADGSEVAALRLNISARHVTECWSANVDKARHNLQRVLGRAADRDRETRRASSFSRTPTSGAHACQLKSQATKAPTNPRSPTVSASPSWRNWRSMAATSTRCSRNSPRCWPTAPPTPGSAWICR